MCDLHIDWLTSSACNTTLGDPTLDEKRQVHQAIHAKAPAILQRGESSEEAVPGVEAGPAVLDATVDAGVVAGGSPARTDERCTRAARPSSSRSMARSSRRAAFVASRSENSRRSRPSGRWSAPATTCSNSSRTVRPPGGVVRPNAALRTPFPAQNRPRGVRCAPADAPAVAQSCK